MSLCTDITGPIILQSYRAIADYKKNSGTELDLAAGDTVEVVEKGESGQSPPTCPHSQWSIPLTLQHPQWSALLGLPLVSHRVLCSDMGCLHAYLL